VCRSDGLRNPCTRVREQMGGALARKSNAMSLKAPARATAAKSQVVMSAGGFVPDMGRRQLMNAFLLGSVAGPLLVLPAVLISYLTPAKAGGGGGGTIAKDALGNDVKLKDWLAKNPAGSRKLVQGLKVILSGPGCLFPCCSSCVMKGASGPIVALRAAVHEDKMRCVSGVTPSIAGGIDGCAGSCVLMSKHKVGLVQFE